MIPLFLPADRLERLQKAIDAGPSAIILDLEDAIAPSSKSAARLAISKLDSPAHPRIVIRVNAVGTPWHDEDMAMVRALSWRPAIMLPKSECPDHFAALASFEVWALIESAKGLAHARSIAAENTVARLVFGSADYCADLGCAHERDALITARSELVLASRLAQIEPAIDGVCFDLHDFETAAADARYAASLGFGGKLCLHPRQLAALKSGFLPSPSEIEWAAKILRQSGDNTGAVAVDGEMVDAPVRIRAQRILSRAGIEV